jgi:hypothetical protein
MTTKFPLITISVQGQKRSSKLSEKCNQPRCYKNTHHPSGFCPNHREKEVKK